MMISTRSPVTRLGGLALLIGLLGSNTGAGAGPTTLRWKFKLGEVFRYESAQTTISKIKDSTGQEVNTTLTLTMDLTWTVKEVDPQGGASLSQTIDRIRTTATMPFGKFAIDSQAGGDAAGPAGPLFKMLVGAEFAFKMNSRGELTDVRLSEKLLSTLRGDNEPAGAQGQFSEAGLKNMLVQMGMILPADAVDAGKTWNRKLAIPAGPDGQTREIEQIYTLGTPDAGKPFDPIDMATKFAPVAADPNVPVTIKTQEATGRFLFDNANGRIDSSKVVERVELTGQIQGKEVGQSNETTTVLTLLHEKTS